MRLVYTVNPGKPNIKLESKDFQIHANVMEEVLQVWHDLGQPECWLFFEVGQAPWHCAAETVRISPQRGKVSP